MMGGSIKALLCRCKGSSKALLRRGYGGIQTGDAYQKHQSDQEKKDAELALHMWHSEFYRRVPARMFSKPSKTCKRIFDILSSCARL